MYDRPESDALAVGWGYTWNDMERATKDLQVLESVLGYPGSECSVYAEPIPWPLSRDKYLCNPGIENEGLCNGDSGKL